MVRSVRLAILLCALSVVSQATAGTPPSDPLPGIPQAAAGPAPACDAIDGFHVLDFWLGDWVVTSPDGERLGRNRIEKILDGCAVQESWTSADGGRGMSLFYFNAGNGLWKQVWVTSRATVPGALKEKQLVERTEDGSLRFQGVIVLEDGRSRLDRTTLTPMPGGRVRQVIEWSRDGGVNWTESFVGIYAPAGS